MLLVVLVATDTVVRISSSTELATSVGGAKLLRSFGIVKTAVIYRKPAAAMLAIDFDKAFAEANIAPGVILLCLHGRCNDRIDADH